MSAFPLIIKKIVIAFFGRQYLYKKYDTYYLKNILRDYKNASTYLNLQTQCGTKKQEFTSKEICYTNELEFGSSIRKVRKIMLNKEVYIKRYSANSSILLYRITIGGYAAKLVMHFYKNSLFLFNYTFSNLSKNDKNKINSTLIEKYLNGNTQFNFSTQNIVDNSGNCIFTEDDVYFTINYISLNHNFFHFLNNKGRELENRRRKREILKKEELYFKL